MIRETAEGDANKGHFLFYFNAGLKAGKKELLASLDRLLRDKSKLRSWLLAWTSRRSWRASGPGSVSFKAKI